MKCTEIEVHNFRGIKSSKIKTEQITAFVGENNAGKSSFLRALNAFFNFEQEQIYFLNGSHFYTKKAIPKIKITLEAENVPPELKSIFNGTKCNVAFKYKGDLQYEFYSGSKWKPLSNELFNNLKKHIDFYLIPLARDHTKISGSQTSLIMQIIKASLEKQTNKRDELSPHVRNALKYFTENVFPKISRELKQHYLLESNFSFQIGFPTNVDYSHILHSIHLKIQDGDKQFSLEDCGSGIQSLTLIALFRYLGSLRKKKFILGIEEPEMNLHPQAQRDLIMSLHRTASDGIQVLLTTHSSVVVDQIDPTNIIICRRSLDETRGFKITTGQLPSNYWDKHGLEIVKSNLFFRYKNSEFFFSKHVIVCEGKADSEVIQILAKRESVDLNAIGVSILNIDGTGNMKYPLSMFKELGLPHSVVIDKDFFFRYKNDELDKSRDSKGYPIYQREFNSEHLSTIEMVFSLRTIRESIKKNLHENHTRALDKLENFSWVCFKYNLETDLVNSSKARDHYYSLLQTPTNSKNARYLLINSGKGIKRVDVICKVVSDLPTASFPHSYSRIKKLLKKLRDDIYQHEADIALAEANVLYEIEKEDFQEVDVEYDFPNEPDDAWTDNSDIFGDETMEKDDEALVEGNSEDDFDDEDDGSY